MRKHGSSDGGLAQIGEAITRCESDLRQFREWHSTHVMEAAELALDIDEAEVRLAELRQRKALLTRQRNTAARRATQIGT